MSDIPFSFSPPLAEHNDLNTHWLQRSLQSVWHPCTQMQHHPQLPLVPIQRAQGTWLFDFNGNRILDAISSWWVNVLGHAHPHITAAIHKQVDTLSHVMLAGFTHTPVIELSERLADLAPVGLGHSFYASDGASAIEIALKMSLHTWHQQGFPQKKRFAYLAKSYHGETAGALSVTDVPLFRQNYQDLLSHQHIQLPTPDPRLLDPDAKVLDPEGSLAAEAAALSLKKVEAILEEQHIHLAAIIVEPLVQGATGMLMYHSAYLKGLQALCNYYDIHLIADEIMTGFGRTGTLFACEQANLTPDFLCLSKGITSGTLPLSVVMTTDRTFETFYRPEFHKGFLHSHSYTGNPIACAAAGAVLDVFEHDKIILKNQMLSQKIAQHAQSLSQYPSIRHLRQRGLILAFDYHGASPSWSSNIFKTALQHEVLLRPIGNTLYIMPPYCITDEELTVLFNAIHQCLS
ncbi:MAG: adenosylmethionine--8-amino-7-oxononanoate transaminase [Pseudomonadota bacterium]